MDITQKILLVALGVLVIALLYAAIRLTYFYRREHLECPKCGCRFKPKLLRLLISINAVDGWITRCPQCHEKEYMEPVRDRAEKQ